MSLDRYLDAIASKTPSPGGGAVAATTGALASAIAQMVVAYSIGKKSLAEHQDALGEASDRLERARTLLLGLAEEDASAYQRVNELMRLPEDDPRRIESWADAVTTAVRVPQSILATSADLARLLETLCERTNRRLASDLGVAAVLAEATARAAYWNVRINLPLMDDERERVRLDHESAAMVRDTRERAERVELACARESGEMTTESAT